MTDEVYKLYNEYLLKRDRQFEYLFRSKMGGKYNSNSIWSKVKSIAKRANLDPDRIAKISPHSMRRTLATSMVENGTDSRIMQGVLGHASVTTSALYAQLTSSMVEKVMRDKNISIGINSNA